MIFERDTYLSQCDKQEAIKNASYVRGDDSDYFVHSFAAAHIAYVLSTETLSDDYSRHQVLVATHYATLKDAIAHVDVQYHIDTCENCELNRAMSHALALC